MRLSTFATTAGFAAASIIASAAVAAPLGIVNGSFESGATGSQSIPGWTNSGVTSSTVAGTNYGFFLTGGLTGLEPTAASDGAQYATAARPGNSTSPGSSSGTATLTQLVDVSSFAAAIAGGNQVLTLTFDYSAADTAGDNGVVTVAFEATGTSASFNVEPDSATAGVFRQGLITAAIPVGTTGVRITASASRPINSATNVSYDNFVGNVSTAVPEPTGIALLGLGGLTLLRRRR